jgi:hypothetical protein
MLHDIFFFITTDTLFTTQQNFHIYFTVTTISALRNITIFILLLQFIKHLITHTPLLARYLPCLLTKTETQDSYQLISTFLLHSEVTRRSRKRNVQICIVYCHYIYNGVGGRMHYM